jgi:hypothetical protein
MKKLLFSVLLLCGLTVHAQPAGGFGGIQQKVELATSQEWKDVNYAGDNQPYHTCDIYLPKKTADTYPIVIHIYGSAWMNNNGKGMADLGTVVRALLDAGYAVVCPNHRSNADQAVGGMPMPPKSKLNDLHCPVLYILGGTTDIAYENGMDDFRLIQHVPACVVNYPVGHGGTYREPHGGEFTVPALAWLQWQLKGDKESAKLFIGKKPELLLRDKWTLECNKKFSELKE